MICIVLHSMLMTYYTLIVEINRIAVIETWSNTTLTFKNKLKVVFVVLSLSAENTVYHREPKVC